MSAAQQHSDERERLRQQQMETVRNYVGQDLSTVMLKAGINVARKHYIVTTMWLLGLIVLQLATGTEVAPEQLAVYDSIMDKVDMDNVEKASHKVMRAQESYYQSKGWFSCDTVCQDDKKRLDVAMAELAAIEKVNAETVREAKATVGISSTFGVQEIRDLFWGTFSKGKAFAQRSTMYDMMFMGLSAMGRDESLMSFLIRAGFQLVLNFTMGLIGALVAFVWYLWDVVSSYSPDPATGVAIFMLASLAATSLVASYLVALYFATAGSVYVVANVIAAQARLQEGREQAPGYIQGDGQQQHQRRQQAPFGSGPGMHQRRPFAYQ
jgi:hypothetical protein